MNSPLLAEATDLGTADLSTLLNRLLDNVGSVVLGKSEVIKLAVVALVMVKAIEELEPVLPARSLTSARTW